MEHSAVEIIAVALASSQNTNKHPPAAHHMRVLRMPNLVPSKHSQAVSKGTGNRNLLLKRTEQAKSYVSIHCHELTGEVDGSADHLETFRGYWSLNILSYLHVV